MPYELPVPPLATTRSTKTSVASARLIAEGLTEHAGNPAIPNWLDWMGQLFLGKTVR